MESLFLHTALQHFVHVLPHVHQISQMTDVLLLHVLELPSQFRQLVVRVVAVLGPRHGLGRGGVSVG